MKDFTNHLMTSWLHIVLHAVKVAVIALFHNFLHNMLHKHYMAHYMVLHNTLHYISSGLIDFIRHLTKSITCVITIYTLFLLHYIDLPVSLHGFNFKLHGLTWAWCCYARSGHCGIRSGRSLANAKFALGLVWAALSTRVPVHGLAAAFT